MGRRQTWVVVSLGLILGCGGGEAADDLGDGDAVSGRAISIISPTDGADLSGPVVIRLGAEGLAIVPAGIQQEHSGHHHLFIDRDITPAGQPIPTEDGIVHLGAAQTEHTLEGLSPGPHTVIAVLGDFQHVRIGDVPPDTVRFSVEGG